MTSAPTPLVGHAESAVEPRHRLERVDRHADVAAFPIVTAMGASKVVAMRLPTLRASPSAISAA